MDSASGSYETSMETARQALGERDFVSAARHLRGARSQPGYERHPEAVALWTSLYTRLPRTAFRGAWRLENSRANTASLDFSVEGRCVLLRLRNKQSSHLRIFEDGQPYPGAPVTLSRDGRFALSTDNTTVKLWDTQTGRCVRDFLGHLHWVRSVSLDDDCRLALSSSEHELRVWNVGTGRSVRTFAVEYLSTSTLSRDGRYVLSTGQDGTFKLWDVTTGATVRHFTGHLGHLYESTVTAQFSQDRRLILSSSDGDDAFRIWDLATGRCIRSFPGHASGVASASLGCDGRHVLSADGKGTSRLWNAETGDCLHVFEPGQPAVTSVHLSADGRQALVEGGDLEVWALDWELGDRPPSPWDEGARPFVEAFLVGQTPHAASLPPDREPTDDEIRAALTRRGRPAWTDADFSGLLHTLGCAGYGWLSAEGIRRELDRKAFPDSARQ